VVPIREENPVFKRSATVEAPVSTAYDQARAKAALAAGATTAAVASAKDRLAPHLDTAKEQWGPALEVAKENSAQALHSAKEAVVPLVDVARAKGADLLSTDTAHEARNRAALMLAAAKGEPVAVRKRRWPLAAAFFAIGTAIGAAVAVLTGRGARAVTPDAEESIAGPSLGMSPPVTAAEPEPVGKLSDSDYASDEGSAGTTAEGEATSTEPDGSLTKPRARR